MQRYQITMRVPNGPAQLIVPVTVEIENIVEILTVEKAVETDADGDRFINIRGESVRVLNRRLPSSTRLVRLAKPNGVIYVDSTQGIVEVPE